MAKTYFLLPCLDLRCVPVAVEGVVAIYSSWTSMETILISDCHAPKFDDHHLDCFESHYHFGSHIYD